MKDFGADRLLSAPRKMPNARLGIPSAPPSRAVPAVRTFFGWRAHCCDERSHVPPPRVQVLSARGLGLVFPSTISDRS